MSAAHQILVTNAYDLPQVCTWHRDGMLIIGDAAHAASPATGHGASMALEDAVILTKTLRDHQVQGGHQVLHERPDYGRKFATYERLRRDRVQADITTSAQMSMSNRQHPNPAQQPSTRPSRIPDKPSALNSTGTHR